VANSLPFGWQRRLFEIDFLFLAAIHTKPTILKI
jgi:hypothetical protein